MKRESVLKEGIGLGVYVVAAMFGAVAGWGSSAVHDRLSSAEPRNMLVVVDYAEIIMNSKHEEVETVAHGMREQIRRLVEAGYVVLDANAVLGTPLDVPVIDTFIRE